MNMVNKSIEIKNPNTPVDNNINHKKNSFGISIFQDANDPANTMIEESRSIAIDIPSTPTDKLMLSGVNQLHESTNSMGELSPAARNAKNFTISTIDSAISATEPVTATARI
jgi:hypothetical protein